MNDTSTIDPAHFDVRRIPCRVKHGQIFQRWSELPVGGHFVLINDHDPVPLYYQFQGMFPGAFTWEYLVDGPDDFHVKITRLAATPQTTPPPPPRPGVPPCGGHDAPRTHDQVELDLRGLQPPEPMLRILQQLEATAPGQAFTARTDRQPIHLLPELQARGASYTTQMLGDGSWSTTITRG